LPHVPGHEISGRVVELNGGTGPAPGTRVVVFHNWGCQQCAACRSGLDNICRTPRAWAGSRIVTVGYRVGEQIAVQSDAFTLWEHELLGSRYGTRADITAGIRLVTGGLLRPVVSQVFALEEANEAVRRLEQGNVTGRLVVSVRPG